MSVPFKINRRKIVIGGFGAKLRFEFSQRLTCSDCTPAHWFEVMCVGRVPAELRKSGIRAIRGYALPIVERHVLQGFELSHIFILSQKAITKSLGKKGGKKIG